MLQRTRFTVRGLFGDSVALGWKCGDWVVHEQLADPTLWCITHLPLGLSLPLVWASFTRSADAVAAMVEVARLRNSWARVTQEDFTSQLREQLVAICQKHHAVEGPVQFIQHAERTVRGDFESNARFNGYRSAPWPE